MIRLKVFYWLLKALVCGILQIGDKQWRTAGKELISKPTFRLPDNASKDRLIGLRMLKRVWVSLYNTKLNYQVQDYLIFDASSTDLIRRKDYIIYSTKIIEDQIYLCGRNILLNHIKVKYMKPLLLVLSSLVVPITLFSKNRIQWALLLSEYVEIIGLTNIIRNIQPKKLFFFSPGEKDSNFIYLVLKKISQIEIYKHPSPGALIAHNKSLMTDVLVLSSKYQEEEFILKLNHSIHCQKTELWQPENSLGYKHLYDNNLNNKVFDYLLGFYSHGGWLRKRSNLSKALFANPDEEENCLKIVARYVKENNIRLKIYLHPKEKEYLSDAIQYYKNFLNAENIDYYSDKLPSSHDFNSVKIGICAYSAILFERDNLGFQTLVWREKNNKFPMKGTALYNKSFNQYSEFKELMNQYINNI